MGGQTFQGRNYAIGYIPQGLSKTQKILQRFPEGAEVSVYYNPQNPSEAVLQNKITGGTNNLLVGIFVVIMGLFIPALFVLSLFIG